MRAPDIRQIWISSNVTSTLLIGLGIRVTIIVGLGIAILGFEVLVFVIPPIDALLILIRPELGLLLSATLLPFENLFGFGGAITAVRIFGFFIAGT